MNIKCTSLDCLTKLFTEGKTYQMNNREIEDDLGHKRWIGSNMSFIIANNNDFIGKAYFKEI